MRISLQAEAQKDELNKIEVFDTREGRNTRHS
jgi:hypothetical protein